MRTEYLHVMQAISAEDIIGRIRTENPWWESEHTISEAHLRLKRRPYFDLFFPLVTNTLRRAVVLMGPRRIGKTVMLHHTVNALIESGLPRESICYVSVDHPIYNGLGIEKMLDYYRKASGIDLKSQRVFKAMLQMTKIDIEGLKRAYRGE